MKEKRAFYTTFCSMPIFLESQFLLDDLADFFRIINVCQCFFTLNMLFDKVDGGLRRVWKSILLDTIRIVFSSKLTDDLNWKLVVTLVENDTAQKKLTMCKKDDCSRIKTVWKFHIFIANKEVGLSFNIWHSRKAWTEKVYYRIYTWC